MKLRPSEGAAAATVFGRAMRAAGRLGGQPLARLRDAVAPGLSRPPKNGDGFPAYARHAAALNVDVNDWIEGNLGWVPALPILEDMIFPLLSPTAHVCEVGVGTGRWSRHIADRIPAGRLILADRTPWEANFLRSYFADRPNVEVVLCDGVRLPLIQDGWADLFFSQGMFVALKLGHLYVYVCEFARCLKPGGWVVFDFIDPETPDGWAFLLKEAPGSPLVFTYHSLSSVVKCFHAAGLELEGTKIIGKSTYVIGRKPELSPAQARLDPIR